MLDVDFQKMSTLELVCAHLQTTPNTIRSILRAPERHYTRIVLSHRPGRQPRVVYETSPAARRLHRSIAVALEPALLAAQDHIQGFRKDHGIRSNAMMHAQSTDGCRSDVVVTADIRAFFDHVTIGQVRAMFSRLGAPDRAALLLARICTLDLRLPQGGRASPIISNLAIPELDRALIALAPRARFSRYADDLTFSGTLEDCPSEKALARVLEAHGFSLRERSYRFQHLRSGQVVNGLSLASGRPSLTRRRRRAIDRLLNIGKRYGLEFAEYRSLEGQVNSIGGVDLDLWETFRKRLDEVTVMDATEGDDPE